MINKDNFKLSIIIPCYNEKKQLRLFLKKFIQNLNNYKFSNFEIIIDDNSKDGTTEILKNLKIRNK